MANYLSDSDDDKARKKFLEAADERFFKDDMFDENWQFSNETNGNAKAIVKTKKSNRYLDTDESFSNGDSNIPEEVKSHVAKRLTQVIANLVEFYDSETQHKKEFIKTKSRVKLFQDFNCFLKSYEEFEFKSVGPIKKPVILRRKVDIVDDDLSESEKLVSAAISPSEILMGKEVKSWAQKSIKNHKMFHYRMDRCSPNILHAVESTDEFTKIRRKNNWNESKISQRFS